MDKNPLIDAPEVAVPVEAPAPPAPKATRAKASDSLSMTREDLSALIAGAIEAAKVASSNDTAALVNAILESRKPYVDPAQKATLTAIRKQMREQRLKIMEQMKLEQASCPHLQGSNPLSDFPSPHGLTALVQHVLDTGEMIGVCTNCGRIFRSCDPDYRQWMAKKSGNRMSSAGRRFFADPVAAIKAGQS
jgi:hypothetical protein